MDREKEPFTKKMALSEQTLAPIWQRLLGKTPPLFAGFLEKAGLPVITGPNSLALRFPASYTLEQEYCGEANRLARMEGELTQITGAPCKLRVELAQNRQTSPLPSKSDKGPIARPQSKRADASRQDYDTCADDCMLASAVRFLIDGHQEDAASVLLSCELSSWDSGDTWCSGDEQIIALHVSLTGPRSAFDLLNQSDHPITKAIRKALEAVLPERRYLKHLTVRAEIIQIDASWREELLEIARGKGVHNQAVDAASAHIWKNLRFRSATEMRIAQALDRAAVLFLPNCRARLGKSNNRLNREADFLVCKNGKWGILEVDGEHFHPPSRAAQDHERDRLFREHGIRLVEHFDAPDCFERPDAIVKLFLDLLEKT